MTSSHPRFPDLPTELPPNLQFVLRLSPSAMTLGLGNIRALLARLGSPEKRFRTVVVAGTNGKGSVTAMTASLLSANGTCTGRYTSPHVFSVTERIAVDDEPVALDEMEDAAARVAPLHGHIGFSYFEALTAIAFLIFVERGVEIAVLETGLGGRFDATNVTDPLVTVLTNIALDHRRILGATEEEILREKLGIVRSGVPFLIGGFRPALREIISEKAARERVPLIGLEELGKVTPVAAGRVHIVTPSGDYGEMALPFAGTHQHVNALLAVGAAERVAGRIEAVARGIAAAYLPGRFERFERAGKTFIIDVAHNDAALCAVADELAAGSPRAHNAVVLGLMKRKELEKAPRRLLGAAARLYFVAPDLPDGPEDAAFTPQELYARYFHALFSPLRPSPTAAPADQSSLTEMHGDAILWNRMGVEDQWMRLLGTLSQPDHPCRNILITGSHHVVEQFGRRLLGRAGC